ncbi:riboflavin synthase [Herbiconiux sp. CPCC 203407]|uniref:Riboflavin synthase n=1 Tax=Herbiconiux oxytropis TaxID=2970915 RepID=A0AA42BSP4_9MICO|nr:riboflavin synthase [Herbiconiux oxytropis]MCS5721942.1 riboflavin synthase [Herbiconiux oxytropis]MCS5725525.1 riboflavin synthase [Herbiconiux oxytropis]
MFTGIIEELGEVLALERTADAAVITVRAPLAVSDAAHGDSIAVSGVCLTVIDQTPDTFRADVMAQTLAMSTIGSLTVGDTVNLERAARVGDRLGGHIVQGHVDGTSTVISVTPGEAWSVLRFSLDDALAPLVVDKGSISVSGVSLTVSSVGQKASGDAADGAAAGAADGGHWFEVSLIPETLTATTLGTLRPGDRVNIETDILARHVERLVSLGLTTRSGS